MKAHGFIILVALASVLVSGCSSEEDQMTEADARAEIGEGFRKLNEEAGLATYFAESNSSQVETWVFIGTNTPYKAEAKKSAPILF